ncbi:hypothetical protein ABFS82_13G006400 [Erythranthe guttata]
MAETKQSFDVNTSGRKRNSGKKKGKMSKKRQRVMPQGADNKVRVDKKMQKMFQKRARDYNSSGEEEEDEQPRRRQSGGAAGYNRKDGGGGGGGEERPPRGQFPRQTIYNKFQKKDDEFEGGFSDDGEEEDQGADAEEVSEDENGGIQPGVTKFAEGINAFRLAFKKIVKKSGGDEDILGPVLSANKKLVAEKLAEEESEKKVKGEAKKEKHLIREKGHLAEVPKHLDAHEKFLLGIATKGVVKLFNAVNKAQNAKNGLNPSRSKDEKVLKKRRKEAFFSELGRTPSGSVGTAVKVGTSGGSADGEGPAWAPLRDNYMLTNPKLKDWDKMQDTNVEDEFGRQSDADSSSGDD